MAPPAAATHASQDQSRSGGLMSVQYIKRYTACDSPEWCSAEKSSSALNSAVSLLLLPCPARPPAAPEASELRAAEVTGGQRVALRSAWETPRMHRTAVYLRLDSHPERQSPVKGSQPPAQSHGRQPYWWSPQYPSMQPSQRAPPTPGLHVHCPLVGSHGGTEPTGWQEQAAGENSSRSTFEYFNSQVCEHLSLSSFCSTLHG